MEHNDQTTSSFSFVHEAPGRGVGGKFRKPSSRKPPSTPYSRPHPRSRWLSKLVDPAYRLISGGATRILPSLFSKSPECSLPPPNDQQQKEDHDKVDQDVKEKVGGDGELNMLLSCFCIYCFTVWFNYLQYGEARLTGVLDPSSSTDGSKNGFDFDRCKQDKKGEGTNGDRVSEIERLVKGKTFSRDQFNHLIEILQSRTVDIPDVEPENKYLSMTVRDTERPIPALERQRKSVDEKKEDLSKVLWGTSTTFVRSSMQDEVGASPIDIARAYMGTRVSELGLSSKSIITKDERTSLNGDEYALKPFLPSPSPKPSTCWPGAMLQDQRAYLTPQSERGRSGLYNFPRTPYSRTIFSKSKSKLTQLQADGNRSLNIPSTPLQQSQTPIYQQSRRDTSDDVRGSVGPIRRMRHKVAESPSRRSVSFHSSLIGQSPLGNSNVSESFFPAVKTNLETGGSGSSSLFQSLDNKSSNSEVGVPPVHPHSSQMARTILEHLERNPPTPKDKSAELKLATSWNQTQSSNVNSAVPSGNNSLLHLGALDSYKSTSQIDKKNSAQNEARANNFFKIPQEKTIKSMGAVKKTTSAADIKVNSIFTIQAGNAGPSQDHRNTGDFQIKSRHEGNNIAPLASLSIPWWLMYRLSNSYLNCLPAYRGAVLVYKRTCSDTICSLAFPKMLSVPNDSILASSAADGEVPNLQRKPSSDSVGTKPVLSSISVGKPAQRWAFSSDNTAGFSFPVSASAGVFSEPPTPTVMPSFPASGIHQPNKEAAVPTYSFGSNKSTPSLVFAFPSTSNAVTHDDASDLKFNFGSEETRISFSSIGKDAICY
ncbi:hypothetical protein Pint_13003 [Pistacia integerrima]|uniref:Uncharacterized protein n=1 Tax=Pistacia integerrima TaxID=434235 RepID=A0ACC0Y4N4_9ROSI|nr:hypothetical protein Pint_13003 [Pistacia integerrima]